MTDKLDKKESISYITDTELDLKLSHQSYGQWSFHIAQPGNYWWALPNGQYASVNIYLHNILLVVNGKM